MTDEMNEKRTEWWGDFTIKEGQTAQWILGKLRIAVQRREREWLVSSDKSDEPNEEETWSFGYLDSEFDENTPVQASRYVFEEASGEVNVSPALADRSVISRPYTPFTIPGGEKAAIFVSTPLWFTLAGRSMPKPIFEVPLRRLSDTWFGPSTQEGDLCYASRTYARLQLTNLAIHPFRAITQVNMNNDSTEPLVVERLNLPVPYLSLFFARESYLWTEAVTMIQPRGSSLAEFHIEPGPPAAAVGAELVASRRQDAHKGMLIRAFSTLMLQGFD